jgi:hypothetical protein
LALIPCAIATLATDAPGRLHSARICAFSSAPYRRRLRLLSVSIVSSYSLTGHDRYRGSASIQDGFAGRLQICASCVKCRDPSAGVRDGQLRHGQDDAGPATADGLRGRFRDGAWVVERTPLSDPVLLAQTFGGALFQTGRPLRFPSQPGRPRPSCPVATAVEVNVWDRSPTEGLPNVLDRGSTAPSSTTVPR